MSGPKAYQFPLGPVPDAAVDILEQLPPLLVPVQRRNKRGEIYDTTKTVFRYRIKYHCCLREETVKHLQIKERIKKGITMCRPCANAKAIEDRNAGWTVGNLESPTGVKSRWQDSFKTGPDWVPISVDPGRPAEYY